MQSDPLYHSKGYLFFEHKQHSFATGIGTIRFVSFTILLLYVFEKASNHYFFSRITSRPPPEKIIEIHNNTNIRICAAPPTVRIENSPAKTEKLPAQGPLFPYNLQQINSPVPRCAPSPKGKRSSAVNPVLDNHYAGRRHSHGLAATPPPAPTPGRSRI